MEKPTESVFACSGCHKKFYLSGFKINRLGLRNKTCLECAARRRRPPRLVKPPIVTDTKTDIDEPPANLQLETDPHR